MRQFVCEMRSENINLLLLLLIVSCSENASGYSVLIVNSFASGSHIMSTNKIAQLLTERGHFVTSVRFEEENRIFPEVSHEGGEVVISIDGGNGIPFINAKGEYKIPHDFLWHSGGSVSALITQTFKLFSMTGHVCKEIYKNDDLYNVLTDDHGYDLVIIDVLLNSCMLGAVRGLMPETVPVVGFWGFLLGGFESEATKAGLEASSRSPITLSGLTDKMNTLQWVYNSLLRLANAATTWALFTFYCDYFIRDNAGGEFGGSKELLADLDGFLIDSSDFVDFPRQLPENFINIGGIHIEQQQQRLEGELGRFIDGARNGVILFSLGMTFQSKHVPKERIDTFLAALSNLSQRVVFKFDLDEAENVTVPANVLVVPFVPQKAVLNHPKTRLFITHCGVKSVIEAVYYGVPMVASPIFFDQYDIMVRVVDKGVGVAVDPRDSSEAEIREKVLEALNSQRILSNVRRLSRRMKDEWRDRHPANATVQLLETIARKKKKDCKVRNLKVYDSVVYSVLFVLALSMSLSKRFVPLKLQWTPLNMATSGRAKNGHNNRPPVLSGVFI